MKAIYPPPLGHEQTVTASELVRHFGVWQDRAARATVYVMHRGRPRLVLASVELMEAMCAPHTGNDDENARLATLLASTRDIIFWCGSEGRADAMSHPARAIFGESGISSVERIASTGGSFLGAALARVLRSGIAESIEIAPAPYPDRRWCCLLEPTPGGALLIARDMTDENALATHRAEMLANEQAMSATDLVASARIGLRGYIETSSAAFAAMTGIATDILATARFVSLFEISSRVAVAEAIEATIADGRARAVPARLLINRGDPASVTLALSAIRYGAPLEALHALVVHHGTANAS